MIGVNQLNHYARSLLINYLSSLIKLYYFYSQSGLKRKSRETLMANELVTILHKLDRDAEELANEREWKRLLIEKEEERKRLVLESQLEEKQREQERKHEMQM